MNKTGKPGDRHPLVLTKTQHINFWKKIEIPKDRTKCWIWTAAKNADGYGSFGIGKTVSSHKIMWRVVRGGIPEGKCVCHSCDNPSCVNPDHLWVGAHKENMADMKAKDRANTASGCDHYLRKKPEMIIRGSKKIGAKLNEKTAASVKAMIQGGYSYSSIASKFGVSVGLIWSVKTGRAWRHVR